MTVNAPGPSQVAIPDCESQPMGTVALYTPSLTDLRSLESHATFVVFPAGIIAISRNFRFELLLGPKA